MSKRAAIAAGLAALAVPAAALAFATDLPGEAELRAIGVVRVVLEAVVVVAMAGSLLVFRRRRAARMLLIIFFTAGALMLLSGWLAGPIVFAVYGLHPPYSEQETNGLVDYASCAAFASRRGLPIGSEVCAVPVSSVCPRYVGPPKSGAKPGGLDLGLEHACVLSPSFYEFYKGYPPCRLGGVECP